MANGLEEVNIALGVLRKQLSLPIVAAVATLRRRLWKMKYDAKVLHRYADGLILGAYLMVALCTLAGGIGAHLAASLEAKPLSMILGGLGGLLIGLLTTYSWHVIAHIVLCFAKIEQNTCRTDPERDDLPHLKKLYQLS
jgi:hypothetical protein